MFGILALISDSRQVEKTAQAHRGIGGHGSVSPQIKGRSRGRVLKYNNLKNNIGSSPASTFRPASGTTVVTRGGGMG